MKLSSWPAGAALMLVLSSISASGQEQPVPENAVSGEMRHSAEQDATARDFDSRIVWANDHRREALFIPAALLEAAKIEDLPLTSNNKDYLQLKIDLIRNPPDPYFPNPLYGPDGECRERHASAPPKPWSNARGLQESLAKAPLVMTATVKRVVTGWDAWRRAIGTMVWMEPQEVLQNSEGELPSDIVILLASNGGQIVVSGTKICTIRTTNDFHAPVAGNVLLIAGTRRTFDDDGFVDSFLEFPVQDDLILPQPFATVRDREPLALGDLRRYLAEKTPASDPMK